ncbi:hypothetical protein Trydic_g7537 [Trypoxylus dichotomus]
MNASLDSCALCDFNVVANDNSIRHENNSIGERLLVRKCLFGPADTAEVEKMLDEELCSEKKRFMDRFGIDIEVIDKKFANTKELKRLLIKVGSSNPMKKPDAPLRGVLKPYNKQLKVTDCFKIKKAAPPSTKDHTEKH